jgi:hypothetical protein
MQNKKHHPFIKQFGSDFSKLILLTSKRFLLRTLFSDIPCKMSISSSLRNSTDAVEGNS